MIISHIAIPVCYGPVDEGLITHLNDLEILFVRENGNSLVAKPEDIVRNLSSEEFLIKRDGAVKSLVNERERLFEMWRFSPADLCYIGEYLGCKGAIRCGDVYSNRKDHKAYSKFPHLVSANVVCARLNALGSLFSSNPTLLALYSYATVCLCHPFYDGNGRVSRAFVYSAYARLNKDVVERWRLEAAFLYYRSELVSGLRQLGISGDWQRLAEYFIQAVELARLSE